MVKFNGTFTYGKCVQKMRMFDYFLYRRSIEQMTDDFDVSKDDTIYPAVVKMLEKRKRQFVNGKDITRDDVVDEVCDYILSEFKIEQHRAEMEVEVYGWQGQKIQDVVQCLQ